jgi:hypothetical protein
VWNSSRRVVDRNSGSRQSKVIARIGLCQEDLVCELKTVHVLQLP